MKDRILERETAVTSVCHRARIWSPCSYDS